MKNNTTVLHLWYNDCIDDRVSSSIVYEYFNKYNPDIDIYKYYCGINNYKNLCKNKKKNDVFVFIGMNFYKNKDKLKDIIKYFNDEYKVIIIDKKSEEISAYIKFKMIKNITYIGADNESLTLATYKYFSNLVCKDKNYIPEIIEIINNSICNTTMTIREYMFYCALKLESFTNKNFFKKVYKSENANVFTKNNIGEKDQKTYIYSLVCKGTDIMHSVCDLYLAREDLKNGFDIYIEDELNKYSYKGLAINTSISINHFYNISEFCSGYYFICTYHRVNNSWVYNFYEINNIDIEYYCRKINNYYLNMIKDDTCLIKTMSNLFNNGDTLILKRGLLNNKIKFTYHYKYNK